MKRRVLFVPMHLSTGGSPQWLLELIKVSILENEVFVAEFNNYGTFNIQKDKIINLVGKKSYECIGPCFSDNWEEERNRLWEIIQEFKPHIIHFNEIPENFETKGGYAKEQSQDTQALQLEFLKPHIIKSDAVITTAAIPGRKAPILIPM